MSCASWMLTWRWPVCLQLDAKTVTVSIDETTEPADVSTLLKVFGATNSDVAALATKVSAHACDASKRRGAFGVGAVQGGVWMRLCSQTVLGAAT